MTWRDQLRPASFRGVPFHAVSDSATFGRRTVLHEYPFRDLPYVEDMGRRAREIRVVGFVIGDDFMSQRDALVEAIEQPGSAKLVHPQYGELTVSVTDGGVTVDHSTAEGGMARISFSCIESGEARFPSAQAATQDVVIAKAADARLGLAQRFARGFSIAGLPAFAQTDALQRATGFLARVRSIIAPIAGAIGRGDVLALVSAFAPQLSGLLRTPLAFAHQVQDIVAALRIAMPARSAVPALALLADFGVGDAHVPPTTATRIREAANRDLLVELVRTAAAIERARAVADLEFADFEDAIALRDSVVGQLDAVADITLDDLVFDALTALRAAVVRDVAERGADLARLVTVTPERTLPALVLAYDLYEDAARDVDLVLRNRIRHPGFVPGGVPLEVPVDA